MPWSKFLWYRPAFWIHPMPSWEKPRPMKENPIFLSKRLRMQKINRVYCNYLFRGHEHCICMYTYSSLYTSQLALYIYICVCVKRVHPVYSPTCYITHLTTASSFYALYVLFVLNVGVLKWRCGCELNSIQALIFVTNVVSIFESCDAMQIFLCWTLCL